MRELQLLRRALADSDFTAAVSKPELDTECFLYFIVDLPPKYRGFPPTWDFAVIRDLGQGVDSEAVVKDAEALVQKVVQRDKNETRLVILSDNHKFILNDELLFSDYLVFCVDARDLPGVSKMPSQAYLAPFPLAIRRKLSGNDLLSLFLNPYMRNKPVTGWRFHGRKRELNRLITSEENFIIVGGRRIGKTSLMLEAHRHLKDRKQISYLISAEACKTAGEVVKELIGALSTRDTSAAVRRSKALDEKLLASLLRQISSPSAPATIFIDELGKVIAADRAHRDDWGFLGILRQFSQQGRLRVIFSCFQETFLSQRKEFEGPLVNFGTTMRLSVFSDAEVEDLLFAPLELWQPAGGDRKALRDLVLTGVGRHPLLLQYFGHALFERIMSGAEQRALEGAQRLLGKDVVDCFGEPTREVFWNLDSAVLCFVFLRHCLDVDRSRRALSSTELNDDWLVEVLRGLGLRASIFDRRSILEGLEVRGLTHRAEQSSGDRQIVSCPVVYKYLKATETDLPRTLEKFRSEMLYESGRWGLSTLSNGSSGA